MICKDQSITFLKSFGYNVVRLPKADLAPLQIFLQKKGFLEPLGDLSLVLNSTNGTPLPVIRKDTAAAAINGQKTSDLSVGIALNVLGNVISAMGGGSLGLNAGFKNAKTMQFSYANVLEDSIQIAQLDQFLTNADINPASRHVGELLEADEIYVLTSTIKTKSLTVEGKQSNNTAVNVDVPVIKEIVGGKVDVGVNNASQTSVTFTGDVPLVFGFKAVRLFFEDGVYQRFDPDKAGAHAVSLDDMPEGRSLYVAESAFVSLK